jgi:hypothetical protein
MTSQPPNDAASGVNGSQISAVGTSATFRNTGRTRPLSAPEADIRGLSVPVYEFRVSPAAVVHTRTSAIHLPMLDVGAEDCRSRETRLQQRWRGRRPANRGGELRVDCSRSSVRVKADPGRAHGPEHTTRRPRSQQVLDPGLQ